MTTLALSIDPETTKTILIVSLCLLLVYLFWSLSKMKQQPKLNITLCLLAGVVIFGLIALDPFSHKKENGIQASDLGPSTDYPDRAIQVILIVQENSSDDGHKIPVSRQDMEIARNRLVERIDVYGNLSAKINIVGTNKIELTLPNLEPKIAKDIIDQITLSAKLTIHSLHPQGDNTPLAKRVFDLEEIVPGYRAYAEYENVTTEGTNSKTGEVIKIKTKTPIRYFLVKRKPGITGSSIELAYPSQTNSDYVNIKLTREGGKIMRAFTSAMKQGDLIVTVLDGEVVNAAILRGDSLGRDFAVSGFGNDKERHNLCRALQTPLENDIIVESIQEVGK